MFEIGIVQQLHSRLKFLEGHMGLEFKGGTSADAYPEFDVDVEFQCGDISVGTYGLTCLVNLRNILGFVEDMLSDSDFNQYVLDKIVADSIEIFDDNMTVYENNHSLIDVDLYIPSTLFVVTLKKIPVASVTINYELPLGQIIDADVQDCGLALRKVLNIVMNRLEKDDMKQYELMEFYGLVGRQQIPLYFNGTFQINGNQIIDGIFSFLAVLKRNPYFDLN